MDNKITYIIGIITIVLMAALFVVNNKSGAYQEEIVKLNKQVESLESEKEKLTLKKKVTEENTFNDDIEWFTKSIYEIADRKQLYDEINESITDPVELTLFGDKVPPEESDFSADTSVKRTVSNIEIFGDYNNDKEYKALVLATVNYVYKEEDVTSSVIAEIRLQSDDNGDWFVSSFEEKLNE